MDNYANLMQEIKNWTLESDNHLFQQLELIASQIINSANELNTNFKDTEYNLNKGDYTINKNITELKSLSDSRFTEQRIDQFKDEDLPSFNANSQNNEEQSSDVINIEKYKQALKIAIDGLQIDSLVTQQEEEISQSRNFSSFSQTNFQMSRCNKLPHMINSREFYEDEYIGIIDKAELLKEQEAQAAQKTEMVFDNANIVTSTITVNPLNPLNDTTDTTQQASLLVGGNIGGLQAPSLDNILNLSAAPVDRSQTQAPNAQNNQLDISNLFPPQAPEQRSTTQMPSIQAPNLLDILNLNPQKQEAEQQQATLEQPKPVSSGGGGRSDMLAEIRQRKIDKEKREAAKNQSNESTLQPPPTSILIAPEISMLQEPSQTTTSSNMQASTSIQQKKQQVKQTISNKLFDSDDEDDLAPEIFGSKKKSIKPMDTMNQNQNLTAQQPQMQQSFLVSEIQPPKIENIAQPKVSITKRNKFFESSDEEEDDNKTFEIKSKFMTTKQQKKQPLPQLSTQTKQAEEKQKKLQNLFNDDNDNDDDNTMNFSKQQKEQPKKQVASLFNDDDDDDDNIMKFSTQPKQQTKQQEKKKLTNLFNDDDDDDDDIKPIKKETPKQPVQQKQEESSEQKPLSKIQQLQAKINLPMMGMPMPSMPKASVGGQQTKDKEIIEVQEEITGDLNQEKPIVISKKKKKKKKKKKVNLDANPSEEVSQTESKPLPNISGTGHTEQKKLPSLGLPSLDDAPKKHHQEPETKKIGDLPNIFGDDSSQPTKKTKSPKNKQIDQKTAPTNRLGLPSLDFDSKQKQTKQASPIQKKVQQKKQLNNLFEDDDDDDDAFIFKKKR